MQVYKPTSPRSVSWNVSRCLAEQRLDTDDGRRRGRPRPGGNPGEGPKNGRFWEKTGKMWEKLGKTWRFGGWFGFREEISGGLSGEWEVNRSWLFQSHFLTHKWWVWCGLKQCKKHVLVVLDHKPCQEFCHTQALGNACCFFLVKCMDFLFCP